MNKSKEFCVKIVNQSQLDFIRVNFPNIKNIKNFSFDPLTTYYIHVKTSRINHGFFFSEVFSEKHKIEYSVIDFYGFINQCYIPYIKIELSRYDYITFDVDFARLFSNYTSHWSKNITFPNKSSESNGHYLHFSSETLNKFASHVTWRNTGSNYIGCFRPATQEEIIQCQTIENKPITEQIVESQNDLPKPKVGDVIVIKSKPSCWSSKTSEKCGMSDVSYPYVGVVESVKRDFCGVAWAFKMGGYGWALDKKTKDVIEILNLPKAGDIIEILDVGCKFHSSKPFELNKPYRVTDIKIRNDKHVYAIMGDKEIVTASFSDNYIGLYEKMWKFSTLNGGANIPYESSVVVKLGGNPCAEIGLDITKPFTSKTKISDYFLIITKSKAEKNGYDIKVQSKQHIDIPLMPIKKKEIIEIKTKKSFGIKI